MAVKSKRKITYSKVNRAPSADTVSALFKELLQITGLTKSDYADLTAELAGVETVREASVKTWLYNGVLPSKGSRKTVLRMFELLCAQAMAEEWSQTFIDLEIKAKQQRKSIAGQSNKAQMIADSLLAENNHTTSGDTVNHQEVIGEEVIGEERIDKEPVRRKFPLAVRLAERIGNPHRVAVAVMVGTLFLTAVLLFLASFINRITIVNEIVIADCSVDLPDTRQSHTPEYSVRVIKNKVPAGEQTEGVRVHLPLKQKQLLSRKLSKGQQGVLPDGGS